MLNAELLEYKLISPPAARIADVACKAAANLLDKMSKLRLS